VADPALGLRAGARRVAFVRAGVAVGVGVGATVGAGATKGDSGGAATTGAGRGTGRAVCVGLPDAVTATALTAATVVIPRKA
jgi:hypothetical protein